MAKRTVLRDGLGNSTLEQAKADLAELETLRERTRTDSEKQLAEAKKTARAEVEAEYGPRLVKAAFGAALSQMSEEDRAGLLDTINPTKFLTEQGDVDTAKVNDWITKYASTGTGQGGQYGDHGQEDGALPRPHPLRSDWQKHNGAMETPPRRRPHPYPWKGFRGDD